MARRSGDQATVWQWECEGRVLVPRLHIARSWCARLRGLMGRSDLPVGEGLLIEPCRAIHTFGMRFMLDVVFLDGDGIIVKVVAGLRPWRFGWGGWPAAAVVEVRSGWLELDGLGPGLRTRFRPLMDDVAGVPA